MVSGKCTVLESMDGSFDPFELYDTETAVIPASVRRYRMVPKEGICMVIAASFRR